MTSLPPTAHDELRRAEAGKASSALPLHVGRPNIGDPAALHRRVDEMLTRGWLTNDGPLVKELERRIAERVGVAHCIAICNATVALELAIRALGLKGEVILPSFTFVATAHALQWQEITPVFCDIDERTHNLDPRRIEQLITPRTTGIIGVHLWGRGCDVEAIQEIASRRQLQLMFDAAHAFDCTHRGRPIGGFGRCEVFSFHATKFINSGEGGAIVTNDDELAARLRLMRNFGFSGYDEVSYLGVNGKMSELSAAMGLTSLDSLDDFLACNRRNYLAYRDLLCGIPGVSLMSYDERDRHNLQYVVVEIDENVAGIPRDELYHYLHRHQVLARRYFYPGAHRMEPYRSYYPNCHLLLPATERLARRVLVLPTGAAVGADEIDYVTNLIRQALGRGRSDAGSMPSDPGRSVRSDRPA
jgi:dTDP-4-amino-4,6-dideoxygalactose transaminase